MQLKCYLPEGFADWFIRAFSGRGGFAYCAECGDLLDTLVMSLRKVGCGRPGRKCTLRQCMNECPSVAGGMAQGVKCSAVPPLALVPLTALWRGKGRGLRGESLGLCDQHSPGSVTSTARKVNGLGRVVCVLCMLLSPLRPFTQKAHPMALPPPGCTFHMSPPPLLVAELRNQPGCTAPSNKSPVEHLSKANYFYHIPRPS